MARLLLLRIEDAGQARAHALGGSQVPLECAGHPTGLYILPEPGSSLAIGKHDRVALARAATRDAPSAAPSAAAAPCVVVGQLDGVVAARRRPPSRRRLELLELGPRHREVGDDAR